ncbi:MAG: galactokinase [Desulfobacterales bacterium]|jgi:D-glycero-alpha-D-manno-heptose-7-phosphate kinase
MPNTLRDIIEQRPVTVSAPCRVDMGGTLDIDIFRLPLRQFSPCTFNIALNLRTRVRMLPYRVGMVKVSSKGFEDAEYPCDKAPYDHPLGLIFAIAAYFRAAGVHILIESSSPPRSALGGSSAAAVALVAAFCAVLNRVTFTRHHRGKIALIAHALEQMVAGVPCGRQDQLAAAYGGVNAWHWQSDIGGRVYRKKILIAPQFHTSLAQHMLLAYCGIPHRSKNINGLWVRQFLAAQHREHWVQIVAETKKFVDAMRRRNYKEAAASMNTEVAIRRRMTPAVLDKMGEALVESAVQHGCGARFTGAGGGGCIWALGEINHIASLKAVWRKILSQRKGAHLLDTQIDSEGIKASRL